MKELTNKEISEGTNYIIHSIRSDICSHCLYSCDGKCSLEYEQSGECPIHKELITRSFAIHSITDSTATLFAYEIPEFTELITTTVQQTINNYCKGTLKLVCAYIEFPLNQPDTLFMQFDFEGHVFDCRYALDEPIDNKELLAAKISIDIAYHLIASVCEQEITSTYRQEDTNNQDTK